MEDLRKLEYLPEPSDRSILSAVDPTVLDFQSEWRSEVMGWAPLTVEPVVQTHSSGRSLSGIVLFAILVSASLFLWQNQWAVLTLPLPDSEWAFEEVGIRELQEVGLSGKNVRVCMVDTGIDSSHEAFNGKSIAFKDFVGTSVTPVDYGAVAHGTLMAGILLSSTHQIGTAPNVTFAMAAALQDNGEGENTGLDTDVADAIRWCQFDFGADIISLSLGGTESFGEGASSAATRQATDAGVFVVAAAGNDGLNDDGDVATPGSVALAISVGATIKQGEIWENSSIGAALNPDGGPRQFPHQKPEVVAPGHRIISTGEDNLWYSSSGTSDSTVLVVGALALILEAHPVFKPKVDGNSSCLILVKQALADSSMLENQTGHDERYGYGKLQAKKWRDHVEEIETC